MTHAAHGNLHNAHLNLQYSQQINRLYTLQFLLNIAPVNLWIAAMKKQAYVLCVFQSWSQAPAAVLNSQLCYILYWNDIWKLHSEGNVHINFLYEDNEKNPA
jgi:hypothetical protein